MSSEHPTLADDDPAAVRARPRHFKWSDAPNTARNTDQFAKRLVAKRSRG